MVTIRVYRRHISLPFELASIALSSRAALKTRFQNVLKQEPCNYSLIGTIHISEFTMRRMISKYSEQAVYRPIDDMRYFFQGARRLFSEPGYPPLFYPMILGKQMGQNKSAVCAIGEGVAGLIAQRIYNCSKLARPFQDGLDVVMVADDITYLVEAKGTARRERSMDSWITESLGDKYLEIVAKEVLSSRGIDIRGVRGLLIGVQLLSEIDYRAYVIEIDVTSAS